MARLPFLDALQQGVLLGDGAIGTELFARGVSHEHGVERVNVTDAQSVLALHKDYVAAGSNVIETNTFGANRLNLAKYSSDHLIREIILAGANLARRAAGDTVYVAGSIGPLPKIDGESVDQSSLSEFFSEQINLLLEGGVDLLMFESFSDLDELVAAVSLARSITKLPIVAQMAFESRGYTDHGVPALEVGNKCREAGADVIGANCGYGAVAVVEALRQMAPLGSPMSAFMNAGFPELVERRLVFQSSPDYLANRALQLVKDGARLVGGCCGVGPDTIKLMARSITQEPSSGIRISVPTSIEKPTQPAPEQAKEPELPGKIVVELDPPTNLNMNPSLDAAAKLAVLPVGAITVADNPLAAARVDNLSFASIVQKATGLPMVLHMNGRDRNRIALQSTIMGAHVLGIRSILCVTGDPIRMCQEPNTSGVFDLSSIALVRMVSDYNSGRLRNGDYRTLFSIGVALNPNVRTISGQINKLQRKIDAGAHFALTQPIFDTERLDALLEGLADENIEFPIYLGLFPLTSLRNAEFLHSEVPGIIIPDKALKRLSRHDDVKSQQKEGVDIAIEVIRSAAGKVHGFYVISPRNRTDLVAPLIKAADSEMAKV